MSRPTAEVEISPGLVEALVRDQFPALSGGVEIVARGWDNVIARLGSDLCVRLPRRELSAPLVRHEAEWLDRLAPGLPVNVPTPVAVGRPGPAFPWTWVVYPWFEGRPLAEVDVSARAALGPQLATFITGLHRPAPATAPVSPWRGIPLSEEAGVRERFSELRRDVAVVLETALARGVAARGHEGPPVWLHGDLHPLNILVGAKSGTLSIRAVIDWGDLCRGDPASDLAVAWLAFDGRGRKSSQAALAEQQYAADEPAWDRARSWAAILGALFLLDAEPGTTARRAGDHLVTQLRDEPD